MREIKFRAWHEPSKRYFKWEGISLIGRYNFVEHITEGVFDIGGSFNSVVLEQYSGRKDINGVEIYEGDEAICDRNMNGEFDKTVFEIKWDEWEQFYGESKSGNTIDFSQFEDAEVVGNIHQRK